MTFKLGQKTIQAANDSAIDDSIPSAVEDQEALRHLTVGMDEEGTRAVARAWLIAQEQVKTVVAQRSGAQTAAYAYAVTRAFLLASGEVKPQAAIEKAAQSDPEKLLAWIDRYEAQLEDLWAIYDDVTRSEEEQNAAAVEFERIAGHLWEAKVASGITDVLARTVAEATHQDPF